MKKYFNKMKIMLIIFSLLLILIPFLLTTETTTERTTEPQKNFRGLSQFLWEKDHGNQKYM